MARRAGRAARTRGGPLAQPKMREVGEIIRRAAGVDVTVLICGESGTGKELVARAIHHLSSRPSKPFVKVNCAAMPREPARERAVRPRARRLHGRRTAKIGQVRGGQRRNDLPRRDRRAASRAPGQAAPRAAGRRARRVGGEVHAEGRVRVIAATNRDLEAAVPPAGSARTSTTASTSSRSSYRRFASGRRRSRS